MTVPSPALAVTGFEPAAGSRRFQCEGGRCKGLSTRAQPAGGAARARGRACPTAAQEAAPAERHSLDKIAYACWAPAARNCACPSPPVAVEHAPSVLLVTCSLNSTVHGDRVRSGQARGMEKYNRAGQRAGRVRERMNGAWHLSCVQWHGAQGQACQACPSRVDTGCQTAGRMLGAPLGARRSAGRGAAAPVGFCHSPRMLQAGHWQGWPCCMHRE